VALVSFVLAVMYLIKDGMKIESMAFATALFIFVGFAGFSQSYDHLGLFKENVPFGSIAYRMTPVLLHEKGAMDTGARVEVPWVGGLMTVTLLMMAGVAICFWLYNHRNNESAKTWGHRLLRVSVIPQAAAIAMVFYQIGSMGVVGNLVGENQYFAIGKKLLRERAAGLQPDQIAAQGAAFMQNNASSLVLNVKGNPVEVAALIAALAITIFLILFSFRTETIRSRMPSLEKLDSLTYKLVGVAFAGLAILLVTGAVWANESWGRYWGWDSKETGALVAWLSYGGYLHSRMAHGWKGRRSAYFAVVGFLLVLFTYLGVSYLLVGLHSYA
jgi:ABC-type transport system involved in cytochrome c biogenesis permease subunit